ncbi:MULTISPECIES: 4-amino-4-deoxy-L-arabinose-phosphoundecaprenol flippase subunit ArnF [Pantoea]|uniref:4-amino-4-deoxy-L-arabinose-phosphoundecaprenol flippase subunit ArnF n=1 Tax=Pantoea TaxID=53335 RepID=UPI00164D9ED3|nr:MULTISPECIES: 4-amino-4-deoxy-L-arabinose-phosphoundecaprenol flippase subunit ArnF [Pantoea]
MKGVMLGIGSVLLVTLAQLTLRLAMRDFPPVEEWLNLDWMRHVRTLLLAAGLGAYALSMLCWMLALRHLPLNRLYPLLSLSYVLVWLAAVLLPAFGEPFRWSSLAGVLLIVLGLLAITVPPRRKKL